MNTYLPYLVLYVNSGGQNPLLLFNSYCVLILNTIMNDRDIPMIQFTSMQLQEIDSYLTEKNLSSVCVRYFYRILYKYEFEEVAITEADLSTLLGIDSSTSRKHLKALEKAGLLNKVYSPSSKIKRVFKITLPLHLTISLANKQKALTFTGTPIEEITSCYEGKQVTEIKLRNVRSSDGSIFFGTYWIDKNLITLETETETECLTFKAVPYITQSEQLLLNITKQMSQHA